MKKTFFSLTAVAILLLCAVSANAITVSLYVDSAPNIYGSPNYLGWESDAFASAASGTFTNMANGINLANVGTTNFEIQDEVVYSFGDLGKRLTWIYWIPNTSIDELTTKQFQLSLINIWDGVTSDFYLDYFGSSWLTPRSWKEYNNGVIGTAGMAWWGAYKVDTQQALDSDIEEWGRSSETWIFSVKWNEGTGQDQLVSITSNRRAVPEPGSILLVASGLLGIAALRRRAK